MNKNYTNEKEIMRELFATATNNILKGNVSFV